ncbi:hypothetical protein [uncultured Croceitalea sp.]|uniref:hypothetical protein n=1 Tax=uncultured Croceitalea sp. TaxID=1798908 RepID=UPI003305CC29
MNNHSNPDEEFLKDATELVKKKDGDNLIRIKEFFKKHKKTIRKSQKALSWVVEHIDDIKEILEAIGELFRSPTEKVLDLDSLTLFGESLDKELIEDSNFFKLIVFEVAQKHGYQVAYSKKSDLYFEII